MSEFLKLPIGGNGGGDGKSAYEVAVDGGFVGDETAWLASLVGDPGPSGLSAYEIAVDEGFVGDEAAWLLSLKGEPGDPGSGGGGGEPVTGAKIFVAGPLSISNGIFEFDSSDAVTDSGIVGTNKFTTDKEGWWDLSYRAKIQETDAEKFLFVQCSLDNGTTWTYLAQGPGSGSSTTHITSMAAEPFYLAAGTDVTLRYISNNITISDLMIALVYRGSTSGSLSAFSAKLHPSGFQVMVDSAWRPIEFTSSDISSGGYVEGNVVPTANKFTADADGIYISTCLVLVGSYSAGATRGDLAYGLDGSVSVGASSATEASGNRMTASTTLKMTAGQTFAWYGLANLGQLNFSQIEVTFTKIAEI